MYDKCISLVTARYYPVMSEYVSALANLPHHINWFGIFLIRAFCPGNNTYFMVAVVHYRTYESVKTNVCPHKEGIIVFLDSCNRAQQSTTFCHYITSWFSTD